MVDEARMARIENKFDEITRVLSTLAQHEERMTNMTRRVDRNEERLDVLETKVLKNTFITSMAQWSVGLVVGGVVTWVVRGSLGG